MLDPFDPDPEETEVTETYLEQFGAAWDDPEEVDLDA